MHATASKPQYYFFQPKCGKWKDFRRILLKKRQQNALTSSWLKKLLLSSSTKPRTDGFWKAFAAALNFVHVFLILTRVLLQQKSRLKCFDIIMPKTPLSFLFFSLWTEETSRNCLRFCSVFNTKIRTHFLYKKHYFSTQLQCLLGVT